MREKVPQETKVINCCRSENSFEINHFESTFHFTNIRFRRKCAFVEE